MRFFTTHAYLTLRQHQDDYNSVELIIRRTISSRLRHRADRDELIANATAHSWAIFCRAREQGHDVEAASRIAAVMSAKRAHQPFCGGCQGRGSVQAVQLGHQPAARARGRLADTLECLPRYLREFASILSTGSTIAEAAEMCGVSEQAGYFYRRQLAKLLG